LRFAAATGSLIGAFGIGLAALATIAG